MGLGGGFRAKNPLPAYIVGDAAGYTHSGPSYWRMDGCSCRARVKGGEKECVCNQKVGLRRCLGRASIKAIHGLCMMYCDRALAARHRQGESAFSHWPSKLSVPGAIGSPSSQIHPCHSIPHEPLIPMTQSLDIMEYTFLVPFMPCPEPPDLRAYKMHSTRAALACTSKEDRAKDEPTEAHYSRDSASHRVSLGFGFVMV